MDGISVPKTQQDAVSKLNTMFWITGKDEGQDDRKERERERDEQPRKRGTQQRAQEGCWCMPVVPAVWEAEAG